MLETACMKLKHYIIENYVQSDFTENLLLKCGSSLDYLTFHVPCQSMVRDVHVNLNYFKLTVGQPALSRGSPTHSPS